MTNALVVPNDLPSDHLLAVERIALQCLYRARNRSIKAANLTLAGLFEFMKLHHRSAARLKNSVSSLVSYPTPILIRIFEHLNLKDRCALANTCHTFRTAGLSAPHLWSQLQLTPIALLISLSIVKKSSAVPLHITISFDFPLLLDDFAYFLNQISDRVEYLDLSLSGTMYGCTEEILTLVWSHISSALSSPYPLLHTLHVTFTPSLQGLAILPTDLLQREAGRLRTCIFVGVELPAICPALSRVLRLDYVQFGSKRDDLQSILANVPLIETLGLDGVAAFSVSSYLPASLTRLAVYGKDSYELVQSMSRIDNAVIITRSPSHDQPAWSGPVKIYITKYGDTVTRFSSGIAGQRTIYGKMSQWTDVAPLHRVVYLAVPETLLSDHGPVPYVPQLTELVIQLAGCFDYRFLTRDFMTPSDFIGIFHSKSPLFHCPSLLILHISAVEPIYPCSGSLQNKRSDCCCGNGISLDLGDVVDFVNHRVVFQAPRLARLIISGIQHFVDVDVHAALGALYTISDEIEFLAEMPTETQWFMESHRFYKPTDFFDTKKTEYEYMWSSYGPML